MILGWFFCENVAQVNILHYLCTRNQQMVNVAQLVRASDCGSEGRGFEPHLSPLKGLQINLQAFFVV